MADLITVRVQVGVGTQAAGRFQKTVPVNLSVAAMRGVIREQANISPDDGVVLIYNGQRMTHPFTKLCDLGICNDSIIFCIISKERGRDIEKLIDNDNSENVHKNIVPVLECEFTSRPFGFAVWANEKGEDAIVTKVTGHKAVNFGIQLGYCIYKVNNECMLNKIHDKILKPLKNWACPVRVSFIDKAVEYTITFHRKPLGFTVIQDGEMKNARVSKINKRACGDAGMRIGSYITAINNFPVFGMKHQEICSLVNRSKFPIKLRFRQPPKLQCVPLKEKS